MIDDYAPSHPSPYCGRLDDHDEHTWNHGLREYICPGPPTITKAEKQAVEKSVRRARGEDQ